VTDLAFCPDKLSSQLAIYGQKLGHNTGEEKQNLLSKKEKQSIKYRAARFYIDLGLKEKINSVHLQLDPLLNR
jgi:hypothetical protein